MKSWPEWIKLTIVRVFYIVGFILYLGGTTIAGVPMGLIGVSLQRYFNVNID